MTEKNDQCFDTRAVHAGYHKNSGPVNPPVVRSSTESFESCKDGADKFASPEKEGIYTRLSNPTVRALEVKIADLEGGYGGIATGSGMAAVNAIYFFYLSPGKHAIATASMYGPSRNILEQEAFYGKWGVESTCLDTSDGDAIKSAIKDNTVLLYVETPANPTLAVTDIAMAAQIAHDAGIPLVVDNTFCSPYLQNPLDLGADVVVHSMTKSIGGHATAVGGMIVPKDREIYLPLRNIVVNTGGILSPDSADLFNTGVKTLGVRMDRMQENMIAVADFLDKHDKIDWLIYPGLENHPQYEVIQRQMKGPGNMASFGVKGGYGAATTVLDSLEVITLAVSLGGVESLIQHPASMTHAGMSSESRKQANITDDLVRISVGIENVDDIIKDLEQALKKI